MDNKPNKSFSSTLDALLLNLARTGRTRKQAISIAVDSMVVMLSLWCAYSLRHGMPFSDFYSTWHLFLVMPIATVMIFMALGIYRWVIRSSNLNLFKQITKAGFASALFFVLFVFLLPPDRVTPRSLFVIYGLLLVAGTCGVRVLWLALVDATNKGEPVAIYGTGDSARQLLASLIQGDAFRPVVFLADSLDLRRTTIGGVPVASVDSIDLQKKLVRLGVEKIILAMPTMGALEYQAKLDKFMDFGLPVLTVPTQAELVSGAATLGEIRDISIHDILGRIEIPANPDLLGHCVSGKNVLVTGGGGSIGSELSRQILSQKPNKLIVLDQSEYNLYQITEELTNRLNTMGADGCEFKPRLGSVTKREDMLNLLVSEQINTVYHAAAYKHVPVIEEQPEQGLETNVFGTLNLLETAIEANVEHFVLISTDKAVRPTSSMGASKRIAELILQAKANEKTNTIISMVRFGNVLGSSGSVVPKFKKQIDSGGPLTLTHPDVTRYFMTIPEAAQLVMQASAVAVGGDVFVLDMGEPVRIEDLAISMIRLSGKDLKIVTGKDSDIEIVVDGLRPGEKMYEELFISDACRPTNVPKVFTAQEVWVPWSKLKLELDALSTLSEKSNTEALRALLLATAFIGLTKEDGKKEKGPKPQKEEAMVDA